MTGDSVLAEDSLGCHQTRPRKRSTAGSSLRIGSPFSFSQNEPEIISWSLQRSEERAENSPRTSGLRVIKRACLSGGTPPPMAMLKSQDSVGLISNTNYMTLHLNVSFCTNLLCDLGQVTQPL